MIFVVHWRCRENVYHIWNQTPDLITLTHEFAHYLLLKVHGFGYKIVQSEPPKYKDPDWQADYLAGALLMDFDLTKGYTVEQLIEECVVSEYAAIVHINAANALKNKK